MSVGTVEGGGDVIIGPGKDGVVAVTARIWRLTQGGSVASSWAWSVVCVGVGAARGEGRRPKDALLCVHALPPRRQPLNPRPRLP